MDDARAHDVAEAVKALVTKVASTVTFQSKYGGEVFVPNPDDPKTFVGGVFAYKDHVSVEFSHGATFDDLAGHLEGKGKARRHVKLAAMREIEDKDLAAYVRQALT